MNLFGIAIILISTGLFHCKSISLQNVLKALNLRTENVTISLGDVDLENIVLSFNGIEIDRNRAGQNGIKTSESRDSEKRNIIRYPELVESIDRSVNPCDDFYSFVCDGWIRSHPIPQNRYEYTQTELLKEKLNQQLKDEFKTKVMLLLPPRAVTEILSTPIRNPSREDVLMTTFYNKCLQNAYSGGSDGFRLLFSKLREVRQVASLTDWLLIMRTEKLLYELTISADEDNSAKNILQIVPSGSMLSAQVYFDPAYTHELIAIRDVLFKILAVIASEDHRAEFISRNFLEHVRRVDSLLRIDQTVAKIKKETEFDSDSIAVSVIELQGLLPSVDWMRYLSAYLPPKHQRTLANRKVRITQVLTVERMEELLSNIDPQTLSDYLDWKIIFHFSDYLGEKFHILMEEFSAQVYGIKERDQADECVSITVNMFYDIAGKHFLRRHFDFDSMFLVKELIEDVRDAFLEMLNENDWMDANTKRRAKQKANAIRDFIAYDSSIFNETLRTNKYAKLNFTTKNSYYDIVRMMELWMQDRAFHRLEETNTRDTFEASVTEVNAFYDSNQNQIALMAGMLQSPFFNASLPRIMNYGAIGVVAGHEITHGFDDAGASYDEVGNRNNWWDADTYKNFEWKKTCFDEQYGSIAVEDLHVMIDGRRTESENIADNGGMRAAIKAASHFVNRSEEFTIEGLEGFTQMQYFFMNYAFIWCGSTRRATLLNKLATDVHPPDMYRVNVVLSNQPEFAKAFNCPKKSPMHPEKTCTVW